MKRDDYNPNLSKDVKFELEDESSKDICFKNTPPYDNELIYAIEEKINDDKAIYPNTLYSKYPDMNKVYENFYKLIEDHINLNHPCDKVYSYDTRFFDNDTGIILSNGCENALRQMISCIIYNYLKDSDARSVKDIEFYYEEPGWRLAKFCALQAGIPEYNIIPLHYEAHISNIEDCEQYKFSSSSDPRKAKLFVNTEFVLNTDNVDAEIKEEMNNDPTTRKFRILYATDKANSWIIHSMKNIDPKKFDRIILDESITMESVVNHTSTITSRISRIGSFSKLLGANFRTGYILTKEPNIDIFREHYLNKAGADLLQVITNTKYNIYKRLCENIQKILYHANNPKTFIFNDSIKVSDKSSRGTGSDAISIKINHIINKAIFGQNNYTYLNQYIGGNVANIIYIIDISKISLFDIEKITVQKADDTEHHLSFVKDKTNTCWATLPERDFKLLPLVNNGVKDTDLMILVQRFYKAPQHI